MESHPYTQRYSQVWEQTLAKGELTPDDVAKSQFYFESDLTIPKPKLFDTFGAVALLPMSADVQRVVQASWEKVVTLLDHPLAYGVEPANRHVEMILFSRPEEIFPDTTIQRSIEISFQKLSQTPPRAFEATFCYPFITPDGTVVIPGYPKPPTAIDDFRSLVRNAVGDDNIPKRQSQWFHISLGRILEPLDKERLEPLLEDVKAHWGEPVTTLSIEEIMWTHEKQWYMVQKEILHTLKLT